MEKDDGDFISLEDGNFSDLDDLPPEEEIVQQFQRPICSSFFSKNVKMTDEHQNTQDIQQPLTETSAGNGSEPLADIQSDGRQLNNCGSTNTQRGKRPWRHKRTSRFESTHSFAARKFRNRFGNSNPAKNDFPLCNPWLKPFEQQINFNQQQNPNNFCSGFQPFASNYNNEPVLQLPQSLPYFQNFSTNAYQNFDRPWRPKPFANNPTPSAFSSATTFLNTNQGPRAAFKEEPHKKILPPLFPETASTNTLFHSKRLDFNRNASGGQYSREVECKNSFFENVTSKPVINNTRLDFGRSDLVEKFAEKVTGECENSSSTHRKNLTSLPDETAPTLNNKKFLDFASVGVKADMTNLFAPPKKILPSSSTATVINNYRLELIEHSTVQTKPSDLRAVEAPCVNVSVPPNQNISKHEFTRSASAVFTSTHSIPICDAANSVSNCSEVPVGTNPDYSLSEVNPSPGESHIVSPIRSSTPIKEIEDADAIDSSVTEGQFSFIRQAIALPVFPELSPIRGLPSPLALTVPKTPPAPVIGELPSRISAKERLGEYVPSPNKSNEGIKDVPKMSVKLPVTNVIGENLFDSSDEDPSAAKDCYKMVIECSPAEKSPTALGAWQVESLPEEKSPNTISEMVIETSEEEKSPIANRTRQRVAIKYSEDERSPIAKSSCKSVIKASNEKKSEVANSSCKSVTKYSSENKLPTANRTEKENLHVKNSSPKRAVKSFSVEKTHIANSSCKIVVKCFEEDKSLIANKPLKRVMKSCKEGKLHVTKNSCESVIESPSEEKALIANSSCKGADGYFSEEKSLIANISRQRAVESSSEENSPIANSSCKRAVKYSEEEKSPIANDSLRRVIESFSEENSPIAKSSCKRVIKTFEENKSPITSSSCKRAVESSSEQKSPIANSSCRVAIKCFEEEKSPTANKSLKRVIKSSDNKSPISNNSRKKVIKSSSDNNLHIANSSRKRESKSSKEEKLPVANNSRKRVIKSSKEVKSPVANIYCKRVIESPSEEKAPIANSSFNMAIKSSEEEKLPVANISRKRVIKSSKDEKSPVANSSCKRVIESCSEENSPIANSSCRRAVQSSSEEKSPIADKFLINNISDKIASLFGGKSPVDDSCKMFNESSSERSVLSRGSSLLDSTFAEGEVSPSSDVNNLSLKSAFQSPSEKPEPERSPNYPRDSNGTGNLRKPISFNASDEFKVGSETVSAIPQLSSNGSRNIACNSESTENAKKVPPVNVNRKIIFDSSSSKSIKGEEIGLGHDILLEDLDISHSSSSTSSSSSSSSSSGVSCSSLIQSRTRDSPRPRDDYINGGSSTEIINKVAVAEESGVDDGVLSDKGKGSSPIVMLSECDGICENARPMDASFIRQSIFPQIFKLDVVDQEVTVKSILSRIGNIHRSLDCQVILTNLPKDTKIIDLLQLCDGLSDPVTLMKCSETCAKIVFSNPLTATIFRAKNENAMLNGKRIKVSKSIMN